MRKRFPAFLKRFGYFLLWLSEWLSLHLFLDACKFVSVCVRLLKIFSCYDDDVTRHLRCVVEEYSCLFCTAYGRRLAIDVQCSDEHSVSKFSWFYNNTIFSYIRRTHQFTIPGQNYVFVLTKQIILPDKQR